MKTEICEICGGEFKNRYGLSKHISQKHKEIHPKNYYDKYLKKENEGICPITGKETSFSGMVHGYRKFKGKGINSGDINVKQKKQETLLKNYGVINPTFANTEKRINNFKKTFKKQRDLKNLILRLIEILRIRTIDKKNKLQCQICGINFNSFRSITTHILHLHKMKTKIYYDIFFKSEKEDMCPLSGLKTSFKCLQRGYYKYHTSYVTKTLEIKKGNDEYCKKYVREKILNNKEKENIEVLNLDKINRVGDKIICKCKKCNTTFVSRIDYILANMQKCPLCFPPKTNAIEWKQQKELFDFISSNTNEVCIPACRNIIFNDTNGRGLELDTYIPSLNLAFEYDGLYWHSDLNMGILAENYQKIKTIKCFEKGIRLIHIFEDEWFFKKDIVKSKIIHILNESKGKKIFARNCKVSEISTKDKNNFLSKFHLQGEDKSKIKLGLFLDKELVSVMTFSSGNIAKGNINKGYTSWELSRYASNDNFIVVGGAGKLLEFFKKNYTWIVIHSFADARWSDGNLYRKLGFELDYITPPEYWYVKGNKRFHRYNLRKTVDEKNLLDPEWVLRHKQGYGRIWDCGHFRFSIKKGGSQNASPKDKKEVTL